MMQMRCKHKKSVKWSGALLALIMAFGATFGILEIKPTRALLGDASNWIVESESGLSMRIVSVQQNGTDIESEWDEYLYNERTDSFGDYYFRTTNSADKIRVGILVDGMEDGESYTTIGNRELTSADNGQVVYEEMKPSIYGGSMQDSFRYEMYDGEEHLWVTPLANEYIVNAFLQRSDWSERITKNLVVRPTNVGNQDIEIMSVQQNGEDVFLDTVGRQVKTWAEMETVLQTINEYRIDDYDAPIEITVKFKHLEEGREYDFSIGEEYGSFRADSTERIETREIKLDYVDRHIDLRINLYASGEYIDNNVSLYFRVADANFRSLGDVIIDEISQDGEKIIPSSNEGEGSREYTFDVNDVQPIIVSLHATDATEEMNYYISYSGYSSGASIHSFEPFAVTGEELVMGTTLVIPAGYGLSEDSPISLNISVNTTGANYSYNSQRIVYENYGKYYSNDELYLNFYEDDELPRFGARIGYINNDEEIFDVINAKYHDENNPLWIRIEGERYDEETIYEIAAKVATEEGEYYATTFRATGAELNEGKTFVINGMTLSLPEFDPDAETSGYELAYDFSLEINGLIQHGTLYYMYDGNLYAIMTYPGGKVTASTNGDGIGTMYMTSSEITVRRSSLDGSRNAVLHYLAGGFDEDLSYDYALYYNSDAGANWWSAQAGEKIDEGVMTGAELNHDGFSFNVALPDNASESSMYSLVITRNGGLVIVSKDFLRFTDAPMIESIVFHADSDSFMQTGRQDYRLERGAQSTVTFTGSGFEDEEEYWVWVTYYGYRRGEDEFGNWWGDDVDLEMYNELITLSGADLNAGFDYDLTYEEEMDEADEAEVVFNVSDKDHAKPDPYDWGGEGVYAGHVIHLNYVEKEDVFRGGGFQIDEETGEFIDVSQPDEPEEFLNNLTKGQAEASVEDGILTLTAEKACIVIGVKGDELSVVEAGMGEIVDGVTTNSYDVSEFDLIGIVLKGDGDLDGEVSSADSNLLNRSLISPSLRPYRPLSDVEKIIFDLDGDGEATSGDSNLINRSLISPSLRPYKAIEW